MIIAIVINGAGALVAVQRSLARLCPNESNIDDFASLKLINIPL